MSDTPAWMQHIEHVVVLMMENRSFDHLLGGFKAINPDCDGVDPQQPGRNTVHALNNQVFEQQAETGNYALPLKPVPFDPKHEFENAIKNLASVNGQPTMAGFADDVYDTFGQEPAFAGKTDWLIQRVMNYFPFGATPETDPLPAIQGLARAYTVCDRWFSSVPGSTWPNRFFAMMGSAHGRMLMPSGWRYATEGLANFSQHLCKTSIFSLLQDKDIEARVYSDGPLPLALVTKGVRGFVDTDEFVTDAQDGRLAPLSWIEPDYNAWSNHGNSQHPPEDVRQGDRLIAKIYNALRGNADVWRKTLFVLLYDEHGGFYDHVPPPACVAPDAIKADVDFDFLRLGVRVPAILVSPWLKAGIDHETYDHTSVLAFLCDRHGLDRAALGQRVVQARHFGQAPIWLSAPRTDTPASLRLASVPAPTRDLLAHETGLAADHRLLVQGLHAYLKGQDVEALWPSKERGGPSPALRALHSPRQLREMADELSHLMNQGLPALTELRASTTRPLPAAAGQPVRLLCLHGVGHGDAESGWQSDPGWQQQWRALIVKNLTAHGLTEAQIDIRYLRYDDLFGSGPNALQLLRAAPLLLHGIAAELAGKRAFGLAIPEMLRWTAGMVVQWLEDEGLRDRLSARLLDEIKAFQPHAVLAHSLGTLIGYDGLRRALVAGGEQAALLDGRVFCSFGSQIAHPVVMREVWGGKVAPLANTHHGLAHWFHLYNPNDRVLTRPINTPDTRRIDVDASFEAPFPQEWLSINHQASNYLDHPNTRAQLWPVLAHIARGRQLAAPAVIERVPVRRRRALLVGINQYPDESMRLNGCVNDVYLLSRTLQQSGYDPADIRLLLDERASAAEIASRLAWLVEGAREGDERVFFYSGHGAQIPAYGPGSEADRMDETLVPVDFDWDDDATHFTDKQFREFYTHLPFADSGTGAGVLFNVIMDCCHAGGMTRGGARVRGINPPNDIRHRMLRWDESSQDWIGRAWREQARGARPFSYGNKAADRTVKRTRGGQGEAAELRVTDSEKFQAQCRKYGHNGPYMPILMYAAREDELASEYDHGAQTYGAFTYALIEQLRKRRGKPVAYPELIQTVAKALAQRRFTQQPTLVGPTAVLEQRKVPWNLNS